MFAIFLPVFLLLGQGVLQPPQPATDWIRGVLRKKDGSLRKGATIFFFPTGTLLGQGTQLLRIKTNKRGRFGVEVPLGRSFLVWAHYKDANGMNWFSDVFPRVRAGKTLLLREVASRPSLFLRLRKFQGWGKPQTQQIEWDLDGTGVFIVRHSLDSRAQVPIPDPFPDLGHAFFLSPYQRAPIRFRLSSVEGNFRFEDLLFLPRLERVEKEPKGAPPRILFKDCPYPQAVNLRVWDPQTKKDLTGVHLRTGFGRPPFFSSLAWMKGPIGKEQGHLSILLPRRKKQSTLLLVARSGFATSLLVFEGDHLWIDGKEWTGPLTEPIQVPLAKREPFTLRLLGLQGKPLKGGSVALRSSLRIKRKPGSPPWHVQGPGKTFISSTQVLRKMDGWPTALGAVWAEISLPRAALAPFLPIDFSHPLSKGSLSFGYWEVDEAAPRLMSFRLENYRLLPFHLSGIDGGPVPLPWVHVDGGKDLVFRQSSWGNRQGKGSLLLAQGPSCFFGFAESKGWFHQDSTIKAQSKGFLLPEEEFQLQGFDGRFHGRVLDPAGEPLAGASFTVESYNTFRSFHEDKVRIRINEFLLLGTTDAQGRFSRPYLKLAGVNLRLRFQFEGHTKLVNLPAGGESLQVVLGKEK